MGLKLKFSICQEQDCKTVSFREETGEFSNDSNPTGWNNASTALISDITTATLSITTPTGTSPTIINIFEIQDPNGFPTADNPSLEYDLTTISLGASTVSSFDDGLYIFKYEVYDATNDQYYSTIKEVLLTCQVECCIKKLAIKIADGTCCEGCADEDIDKFLTGFALLQTLKNLAGCGNSASIAKTLKTLQNLCNNSECSCS